MRTFIQLPLPIVSVALAVVLTLSSPVLAQDRLHINIYGPGQPKANLYLAPPSALGSAPERPDERITEFRKALKSNLGYLPFIHEVKGTDILGGQKVDGVKGPDIDFKRFSLSQVDLLITTGWKRNMTGAVQVEIRAFEVFSSSMVVGRGYVLAKPEQIAKAANRFCADLMEHLTGKSSFFRSRLAFSRKQQGGKQICVSTPQGHFLEQITDLDGACMSPAWSFDGKSLVFSFVGQDRHELMIWDNTTGKLESVLLPGNTIISPTFRADGTLTVSIDPHGNPDIYDLTADNRLGSPLVRHWGIDISPDFERSGEKMVFVSSRLGNPHIFLLDLTTKKVQRISYEGTYNTHPSISPNGRYVAYSRLTDQGHRIIVHDLKDNSEWQVTSGPGNDEDPAWGPDSYFLAFSSNRSGSYKIYVTTRHGYKPTQIPTGPGDATAPAWNPVVQD